MKLYREFKAFAIRGNVVDLTVGVIIGAAFSKIVDSVINDLVLPLLGKVIGDVDFSNLYVPLSDSVPKGLSLTEARELGSVFAYGHFLSVLIHFVIMAFCIFIVVKAINALKKRDKTLEEPTKQELLLTEIRDLLKDRKP